MSILNMQYKEKSIDIMKESAADQMMIHQI